MSYSSPSFKGMSLFTHKGERKYLTSLERERFLKALPILTNLKERSFCEMIFWTGCRPSESLALTALNIDIDEYMVIIRSLKKRGRMKGQHFRPLPLPEDYMHRLNQTHAIREAQAQPDGGESARLWDFSRTKGWKLVKTVMSAAGISGAKGCGRGLRHAYGVNAALKRVPETRIKKWLGHESLATTEIYLDIAGAEDRLIAERMWS